MAAPTPEAIDNARRKVEPAKARLQELEARAATLNRKQDAPRKSILGGLRSEAAVKDTEWASLTNHLMGRTRTDPYTTTSTERTSGGKSRRVHYRGKRGGSRTQ